MATDQRAEARWTTVLDGVYLLRGQFQAPFRPHTHTRYIVGVVDRGSVVLSRGRRSWVATQADLIGLRRHEVHEDRSGNGQPWTWRLLYASADTVRAAVGWAGNASIPKTTRGPVTRDPGRAAQFSQLFDALWAGEAVPQAAAETTFLLGQLFAPRADPRPLFRPTSRTRKGVATVRHYLHHARATAIGVSCLARLAGLSPYHMIRAFRDATGLPPHAYYQQVRLARAKEMLWRGRTLSEVAFELGFSDQSHFCREFKRTTQITPSQYAAMVRASGKVRRLV